MQAQHLYERMESRTLPLALGTIEPRDAPRHYGHFDRLPCRDGPDDDGAVLVASGPGRVTMVLTAGRSQASTPTGSLSCWGRDAGKVRGGDAGVVVDEVYRGNRWVCGRGHGLGLYAVITTATNTSMLALVKDKGVLRDHEFGDAGGEMYYGLTAAEWNHIEKNKNML
ncbi:hypothetical protein E5D57_011525 [Metarhizium anisopliae]|nr:hypothetical protein E5D57_011525 [Metarhizium anisopliae]